jgi:hypothetical protein
MAPGTVPANGASTRIGEATTSHPYELDLVPSRPGSVVTRTPPEGPRRSLGTMNDRGSGLLGRLLCPGEGASAQDQLVLRCLVTKLVRARAAEIDDTRPPPGQGVGLALEHRERGALSVGDHRAATDVDFGVWHYRASA